MKKPNNEITSRGRDYFLVVGKGGTSFGGASKNFGCCSKKSRVGKLCPLSAARLIVCGERQHDTNLTIKNVTGSSAVSSAKGCPFLSAEKKQSVHSSCHGLVMRRCECDAAPATP